MKRKVIIAVVLAILLIVFVAAFGKSYHLPFGAEEVAAVTFGNDFWRIYKQTETEADIVQVVKKMNRIRLCGLHDPEKDPEEGAFGYTIQFILNDGRKYTFHAVTGDGLTAFFTDETGTTYKVRNFQPQALWNQWEE